MMNVDGGGKGMNALETLSYAGGAAAAYYGVLFASGPLGWTIGIIGAAACLGSAYVASPNAYGRRQNKRNY